MVVMVVMGRRTHGCTLRVKVGLIRTDVIHPESQATLTCKEKRYHPEYILSARSFDPQSEIVDTRPQHPRLS